MSDVTLRQDEAAMISRFSIVAAVINTEEPRVSQTNVDTVIVNVGDEDEVFPVILQGKLCQLVLEKKLVAGDKVYIDGRIRKDKTFSTTGSSKAVVMLFAAYISVLPW